MRVRIRTSAIALISVVAVLIASVVTMTAVGGGAASAASAPTLGTPVTIKVVGNHLVNATGQTVRLLGVNRSGSEYACAQGWGLFDGPIDAASIASIASWNVNAVRLPLNEDCWLGINGVNAAYSGINYQNAIAGYVKSLHNAGMAVVLDLHWNAAGTTLATSQQLMADADHAPAFWTSVATVFKADPGVIFDLYNEPHDISWSCWRDGCMTSGGWQAAGMQSLVNAVRSTGARQPIMVSGLNWAGDLSAWNTWVPNDPQKQLIADLHLYNFSQFNTQASWDQSVAPTAALFPIVAGEIGETDCAHGFIDSLMNWFDGKGISYMGWTWDAAGGWSCTNGPSLISDYSGTPTGFGVGYRDHLAALAGGTAATTTSTSRPVSTTTTAPSTTTTTMPTSTTTTPSSTGVGKAIVRYRVVNAWPGGLQASIDITNTGTSSIGSVSAPWSLKFQLPSGVTMSSLWNADWTTSLAGSSQSIVATGPSWHRSIAPGETWSVGYVLQGSAIPTSCSLNSATCVFTIG